MAKQEVKIRTIGRYDGHNFKPNGAVELRLKFPYEELVNYYVKLPLLRSENTTIRAKLEDGTTLKLGTFMFHGYSMDHDGEGKMVYKSLFDSVEPDSLNTLVPEKDKPIRFMFVADIEAEEEEDEG